MNIPLLISPINIIMLLIILITFTVIALVLALKKETKFHFLIWATIIIFLPFFGSLSYFLKFFTSKRIKNNVA